MSTSLDLARDSDGAPTPQDLSTTGGPATSKRLLASGWVLLGTSLLVLLFWPGTLSGIFDAMFESVRAVVVDVFLLSTVGIAIIVSVIAGRLFERLGFTDALVRSLAPLMRFYRVNPTVIVPAAYNILGDINAAGRIAGPILRRAKATRHEQMIAVVTMVQSQQSLATFVIGILALSAAHISVFPVVVAAVFAPLVLVPPLLSRTLFRDTKRVAQTDIPSFTPRQPILSTLFGSAREGAELLFLVVIPAVSVVFAAIGVLDYFHIWTHVENAFSAVFTAMLIEPTSGLTSVVAAPTLAMAQLTEIAASVDPRLVVGSFVIASSGLPLSVIFGQVPAVWAETSDLSERDTLIACTLGIVMRIATAFVIAATLTFT